MAMNPRCESPRDPFPGPSGLHVPVLGHVIIVIKVDKLMISHLPIGGNCKQNQKEADQESLQLVSDLAKLTILPYYI